MALVGKKILCVGGNGYTGNYFASRLIKQEAAVSVLCRSGPKHSYSENQQINWLIGSVFEPKKFEKEINEADAIIHTVGTLFDTSITKNAKPGEPGTYEAMNRDSLKSVLETIEQNKKKQVIYLSAIGHPPFIPRYATTKKQAEDMLLESIHDGYAFKPGVVYSWEHRKWSVPLKYEIQAFNKVYPWIHKLAMNGTYLQRFIENFKQTDPTSLQKMGDAIIELVSQGQQNPEHIQKLTNGERLLENQQLYKLSESFVKRSNSNKKL